MYLFLILLILLCASPAFAIKAFPSAEGFGADTTVGGRGGTVMYITNLNDAGSGSFRACAEGTGARICIFKVGGRINLQSRINILAANSFVTIAGQTAPGEGITIGPWPVYISGGVQQVIIRHLRHVQAYEDWGQTPPFATLNNDCGAFVIYGNDGIQVKNIILDHVSAGYQCDDGIQMSGYVTDATVQWSMSADAYDCRSSGGSCTRDPYGASKGFIFGGNDPVTAPLTTGTVHHSAFLQSDTRNPGGGPQHVMDWRHNIIYNWSACTGGLRLGGTDESIPGPLLANHNMVGNRYIPGPDTNPFFDGTGCWLGELRTEASAKVYLQDNVSPFCGMDACPSNTFNLGFCKGEGVNVSCPANESEFRVSTPFTAPSVSATPQNMMESTILAKAGATVPKRDSLDARVVSETQNRTGDIGRRGAPFPNIQNCGAPFSTSPPCTAYPTDSDGDGVPDAWESTHSMNNGVNDANSTATNPANGYTNIENYLNELAGDDIGGTIPPEFTPNATPIYVSDGSHGDSPTDSGNCGVPETITTPRATLGAALACMQFPGKVLYVRGGTYAGIINTSGGAILGGNSSSNPTRIEGYQSEVATIQMPVGGINALEIASINNLTVQKLTIDAMSRTESNALACLDSNNIVLNQLHLRNAFYEVAYFSNCNNVTVAKSQFHDTANAAVISLVGTSTGVNLSELDIYNGPLNGIDAPLTSTNNNLTITRTQIHNTGTGAGGPAINLGGGSGAQLVNNIIDHNNAGIRIRASAQNAKIYHNAIGGNTLIGIQCDSGATGITIANNIIFGNGTDAIQNNCGATLTSQNFTTNPQWTSLAGRDFHLQTSSTAIDTAPTIAEVTTSFDGTLRGGAQGPYDYGPYETSAPVMLDSTALTPVPRQRGLLY